MSGLNTQVIILVPTSTAGGDHTYISETFDAEIQLTVQLTPQPSTDGLDLTLTDMPSAGMWAKAHIQQLLEIPAVADIEQLSTRLLPKVSLVMSTPTLVAGRPMTPKYVGVNDQSYTLRTDAGHLQADPDPDPKWDSVHSTWIYPPPTGGVGDMRWTVNSMPDPAPYGGSYSIGLREAIDGSLALPSTAGAWAADSSTPTAPAWNSRYPYKPNMVSWTHHSSDGRTFTTPKAIQFNMHYVEHFWLDMGGNKPPPYTWIVVGFILDFTGGIYRHYMLDSGKNPYNYVPNPDPDDVSNEYDIPGNYEGLNYRNYMAIDRNNMYVTNQTGRALYCHHHQAPTPKMYYSVINGNSSMVGNMTNNDQQTKTGKLPIEATAHRYYLMGRGNGKIGSRTAANMVIFEARFWNRALSKTELNAQYAQLSSTWKFSQYK